MNKNLTNRIIKKYLPHNFLAEKMVLKSVCNKSMKQLKFTIKILPIEAFYFKNHQEIYKAILFMHKIKCQLIF